MKKLGTRGFSHLLIPVMVFLLVGVVGGTYFLRKSHAAPITTSTTTTQTAAASGGNKLCTKNGYGYCLGSNDLNAGTDVYQRYINNGRLLEFFGDGGSFHNHPTGLLKFNGDLSKCLALSNGTTIVANCSANYTVWAKDATAGYDKLEFINRKYTQDQNNGHDWVLSTDNNIGDVGAVNYDGATGWYQKWQWELP